jgi:hypothetical protein
MLKENKILPHYSAHSITHVWFDLELSIDHSGDTNNIYILLVTNRIKVESFEKLLQIAKNHR